MTGESDTGTSGPRGARNGGARNDRRPRDLAVGGRRSCPAGTEDDEAVTTSAGGKHRGSSRTGAARLLPMITERSTPFRARQVCADNRHYVNSSRHHRLYGSFPAA